MDSELFKLLQRKAEIEATIEALRRPWSRASWVGRRTEGPVRVTPKEEA